MRLECQCGDERPLRHTVHLRCTAQSRSIIHKYDSQSNIYRQELQCALPFKPPGLGKFSSVTNTFRRTSFVMKPPSPPRSLLHFSETLTQCKSVGIRASHAVWDRARCASKEAARRYCEKRRGRDGTRISQCNRGVVMIRQSSVKIYVNFWPAQSRNSRQHDKWTDCERANTPATVQSDPAERPVRLRWSEVSQWKARFQFSVSPSSSCSCC